MVHMIPIDSVAMNRIGIVLAYESSDRSRRDRDQEQPMVQVIGASNHPRPDAADELHQMIADAYALVHTARDRLAVRPSSPELVLHLQTAEAELVRATVALKALSAPVAVRPLTGRPVIPFDRERSAPTASDEHDVRTTPHGSA